MMKYVTRRIAFLTALYVCIIFGIFALQFTSGNAFSVTFGSLRVSGSRENGEKGSVPDLPLHIGMSGLDLFVDTQNSLMAYTSEKNGTPLKVTGLVTGTAGFTLMFSDRVSVEFVSEKRGDRDIVRINASIPEKYRKITFPYKVTRSARLDKKDSIVLVTVSGAQYSFLGTTVESPAGNGVRSLAIARDAPVVLYQTWIPVKGLNLEDFVSIPNSSDADHTRTVDAYSAKALSSFKKSVSSGHLTEPLVAAYIAEMGRIGMYRAAVESIPEAWRNGPSRSWQTNTFLNNLETTWVSLVSKEREDRVAISRKLTENNAAVFEFPSLVPYLIDRGSSLLLKDLTRFAGTVDTTAITAFQAAGILEAMTDFALYASDQTNTLLPLADTCERKLKSSFVLIGDALYISDDGKTVDTLSSLRVASILIDYGKSSSLRTSWRNAGNLLLHSIVSFADEDGNIPSQLAISEGDTQTARTAVPSRDSKTIDPSVVYPVVATTNTWYPHELSLAREIGAGTWAWTSAESVKVSNASDGALRITTKFPQGETHYMVIRGIKPFYRIVIYGMDFRTDPRFESYNSSGYRYNEETQTLFLKMRHKTDYEDILIYPGKDPNAPPVSSVSPAGIVPVPTASVVSAEGTGSGVVVGDGNP
jgi:hypothetical protein